MHILPQRHKFGCTPQKTFKHPSQAPLTAQSSRSPTRHALKSPSTSGLLTQFHSQMQQNPNEGWNGDLPNTSSNSLCTFFWISGLRPSKYKTQFMAAAVVSWPYRSRFTKTLISTLFPWTSRLCKYLGVHLVRKVRLIRPITIIKTRIKSELFNSLTIRIKGDPQLFWQNEKVLK